MTFRRTNNELKQLLEHIPVDNLFIAACFLIHAEKVRNGEIEEDEIIEPGTGEVDRWLDNLDAEGVEELKLTASKLTAGSVQ
jgi:hypothetical protein